MWHLNDSCRERGSRVDRHAGIGAGQMGLEPFRHLVNDPRFRDLPLILETPKGIEDGEDLDARNLESSCPARSTGACSSQTRLSDRDRCFIEPSASRLSAVSEANASPMARVRPRRSALSCPRLKSMVSQSATAIGVTPAAPVPDPGWFINRELSWLDFNERVLEEARDPTNPLLDRLRFLAICASNLDEFFEVRVAGLQAQLYENLEPQDPPPDGLGPLAQLIEITRRAHDFVARMYEVWFSEICPLLIKHGIRVCSPKELTAGQTAYLDDYFDTQVYPVLTPLAIDPAHPFPHVHNKSLNLLMRIESSEPHERKALRRPSGPGGAQPSGPLAR